MFSGLVRISWRGAWGYDKMTGIVQLPHSEMTMPHLDPSLSVSRSIFCIAKQEQHASTNV